MTRSVFTLALALSITALNPSFATSADSSADKALEADKSFAAQLDLEPLRGVPVQEGGRRKPLDTMARELVFKITESRRYQKLDPLYVLLSMAYDSPTWQSRRCIAVRNLELIAALQKDGDYSEQHRTPGARLYISARDLRSSASAMRLYNEALTLQKMDKPITAESHKAVLEAAEKGFMLESVGRMLCIVPVSDNVSDKWTPVSSAETAIFKDLQETEAKLVAALQGRDQAAFNQAAATLVAQMQAYDFKVWPYYGLIELEVTMNSLHPFSMAQAFYFIAVLGFIAALFKPKLQKLGFVAFGIALAIHVAALTARGFLVSRSPVASLYETLVFMTGFAALMAGVLELTHKRQGWFALGASVACVFGLFMGDTLPIYASNQGIQPLVPVLRSYWLNIHVTCMIASYGACLMAFSMSLVYYVRFCFQGPKALATEEFQSLDTYIYRSVQVAFFLLTVGIILGGVWANQSWGRYWDWDPKETWAFITWAVYAVYLHMRLVGYGKGIPGVLMNFFAFWCMMFTYLGVSYVLPGLHSYVDNSSANYGYTMGLFALIPALFAGALGLLYLFGKSFYWEPAEKALERDAKAEAADKAADAKAKETAEAKA